ncbi:hypothetical protein ACJZ2D_013871 [Fusarium nematophilum]
MPSQIISDSTPERPNAKTQGVPPMLGVWLNEPSQVLAAADTWSSERAISQPRSTTTDPDERRRDTANDGHVAQAA